MHTEETNHLHVNIVQTEQSLLYICIRRWSLAIC